MCHNFSDRNEPIPVSTVGPRIPGLAVLASFLALAVIVVALCV